LFVRVRITRISCVVPRGSEPAKADGRRYFERKRIINVDEDVQVVVNRSENEGDWPYAGVHPIGSCVGEKCACNECREHRIYKGTC